MVATGSTSTSTGADPGTGTGGRQNSNPGLSYSDCDSLYLDRVADCVVEVLQGQGRLFRGNYAAWLQAEVSAGDMETRRRAFLELRGRQSGHGKGKGKGKDQGKGKGKGKGNARTGKNEKKNAANLRKLRRGKLKNSSKVRYSTDTATAGDLGLDNLFGSFQKWDSSRQARLEAVRGQRREENPDWAEHLEGEAGRVRKLATVEIERKKERLLARQKLKDRRRKMKEEAQRARSRERAREGDSHDRSHTHRGEQKERADSDSGSKSSRDNRTNSGSGSYRGRAAFGAGAHARFPVTTTDCLHALGLSAHEDHGADRIKQAFRYLALAHHPDTGGDEEVFKKINHAYRSLLGKSAQKL